MRSLLAVAWPLLAPVEEPTLHPPARRWWAWVCILSFFPVAAAFHNRLWWRPTCMLNSFGVDYTDWGTFKMWLSQDSSPSSAALLMLLVYFFGRRRWALRALVAPVVLTGAPLALWLWDIPGTSRWICLHLHDNRLLLWPGQPLTTKVLTVVAVLTYTPLAILSLRRFRPAKQALPG